MAVTLRDIGRAAGVSPATVSLALRDDERVAAVTKQKVRDLAVEMGYVPNPFGRSLQANKSHLIGYLAPTLTSSFYDEVIQDISDMAGKRGYGIVVGVNTEVEAFRRHIRLLRDKRIDGIVVSYYPAACVGDLEDLGRSGVALVVCDFETFSADVPKVQVDNGRAMELVAEHLLGLGHRRVAYCYVGNQESHDRFGVLAEMLGRGGGEEPVACGDEGELAAVLEGGERPTAVVCYSDVIAVAVKHAVEARGLRAPQDVSIVGFDDVEIAGWPEFSLTTVAQPKGRLGTIAMEMLLARIGGRKVETQLLEPRLVVRGSTGRAPNQRAG